MPGIMNKPTASTTAPNDMSMAQSYEQLERFMNINERAANFFTIEDDNYGVGILCANTNTNDRNRGRVATTVRLDKDQIRHFMVSHGFQVEPSEQVDTSVPSGGFICTRPSQ